MALEAAVAAGHCPGAGICCQKSLPVGSSRLMIPATLLQQLLTGRFIPFNTLPKVSSQKVGGQLRPAAWWEQVF